MKPLDNAKNTGQIPNNPNDSASLATLTQLADFSAKNPLGVATSSLKINEIASPAPRNDGRGVAKGVAKGLSRVAVGLGVLLGTLGIPNVAMGAENVYTIDAQNLFNNGPGDQAYWQPASSDGRKPVFIINNPGYNPNADKTILTITSATNGGEYPRLNTTALTPLTEVNVNANYFYNRSNAYHRGGLVFGYQGDDISGQKTIRFVATNKTDGIFKYNANSGSQSDSATVFTLHSQMNFEVDARNAKANFAMFDSVGRPIGILGYINDVYASDFIKNGKGQQFVSMTGNVKTIGLDNNKKFASIALSGSYYGYANYVGGIFLNHKGSVDVTNIAQQNWPGCNTMNPLGQFNYFGDKACKAASGSSSMLSTVSPAHYYRPTQEEFRLLFPDGVYDESKYGYNFMDGISVNGVYKEHHKGQNTSLGKTLQISGDIVFNVPTTNVFYVNTGNAVVERGIYGITNINNSSFHRMYANFDTPDSYYYGDITGNGSLYLAFLNGAKFKGNAQLTYDSTKDIDTSTSKGSIYNGTNGAGYRNIYFQFADGQNVAKDQFYVQIGGGKAGSRYVVDNLDITGVNEGNALKYAGIDFIDTLQGTVWTARSNIKMAVNQTFAGNKGGKWLFGNAYDETLTPGFGGDYNAYIRSGYAADGKGYALKAADDDKPSYVSSANINLGSNAQEISFIFKDGTFDFAKQDSGYTGTITGGTADSVYRFVNAGTLNNSQIENAVGKLSLINTRVTNFAVGNNNKAVNLDVAVASGLNPVVVGNARDRIVRLDFTNTDDSISYNKDNSTYITGAAQNATYTIWNLNNRGNGIATSKSGVVSRFNDQTKNYDQNILGVLANAGVVFDNLGLAKNASGNTTADSENATVKRDTNINDTPAGAKFVLRGVSINGEIVDNRFSYDAVFDNTDADKGKTAFDNDIEKSTFAGNSLNFSDNNYTQSLAFIGAGALKATSGDVVTLTAPNAALNLTLKDIGGATNLKVVRDGNFSAGTSIVVKDSNFEAEKIITANGWDANNSGKIYIQNQAAGKAKIGLIQNGAGDAAENPIAGAGTNSVNAVSLRFGKENLESTGELKGTYNGVNLNGKKVTTIALSGLATGNAGDNHKNAIEIKTDNSGGIIELVAESGGTYSRAGKVNTNQSALIGSGSNIDLKGTSLVGDVIARHGTFMRGVFASGAGAENLTKSTSSDFVADSKYYGGVLMLTHRGGDLEGDNYSGFSYENNSLNDQGFWFIGANSHNFKAGKVDENNTITTYDGSTNNWGGYGIARFINADNVDGALFKNWGTNSASAPTKGNTFELVGTSIKGDINATATGDTLGYMTQRSANAAWTLKAVFDNRESGRGTTDANGLITNAANELAINKSSMDGNLVLGNSATADIYFRGVGSHKFTKEGQKTISGGTQQTYLVFDNAFGSGSAYTYDAIKNANGRILVVNSDVAFDSSATAGSGVGDVNFFFYKSGGGAETAEGTGYIERTIEQLSNGNVALDKTKDTSFSGGVHATGGQTLNLYFVGGFDPKNLLQSVLAAKASEDVVLNADNRYTFVDTGYVDFSGMIRNYTNINGENVGFQTADGQKLDLTTHNVHMLGSTDFYYGRNYYAAEGSGFSVIGDDLNYRSGVIGTTPGEVKNDLSFLHFANFYDNGAGVRHDIEFDFGGNLKTGGKDKMGGYIQGAGKDESGAASRYVFKNLGQALNVSDSATLASGDSSVEFDDLLNPIKNGLTTNYNKKTLNASEMSGMQRALIDAGIKFYVDSNDENKSGTIIGLRNTALKLNDGYTLNSEADNKFGYDLSFNDSYALSGNLDLASNNNDLILRFEGRNSWLNGGDLALGNGKHDIYLKNLDKTGNAFKVENGTQSGSTYTFDSVKFGSVGISANNAQNIEFNAKHLTTTGAVSLTNTGANASVNLANSNVGAAKFTDLQTAGISISHSNLGKLDVSTTGKLDLNITDSKSTSTEAGSITAGGTGSYVRITNSGVKLSEIKLNNTLTAPGGIFIDNSKAGNPVALGLIQVVTSGQIQSGAGNDANRFSVRLGSSTLDSIGTLKGTYSHLSDDEKQAINAAGVTTLAIQSTMNASNNGNSPSNVFELKANNSGGIIEFAQADLNGGAESYNRAGKGQNNNQQNHFARLGTGSNINTRGVSLVGDVITRHGMYTRMIFAKGDGIGNLGSKSNADYIAESKYYGGVLQGAHRGTATGFVDGFEYGLDGGVDENGNRIGIINTQTQGYWFIGADSHNFKNGKTDATNTIIAFDSADSPSSGQTWYGWSTFRFINADHVDGALFKNYSSNRGVGGGTVNGNEIVLVGTSIKGDINATAQVKTLNNDNFNQYHGDATGGARWNLTAVFDSRESGRGKSDAGGVIEHEANFLDIAKSSLDGNVTMGNNAVANLTFYGAESHKFTEQGGNTISGGNANSKYIFDGAFDEANTYTYDAFKNANGNFVFGNSSFAFDSNATQGTGAGSLSFYVYNKDDIDLTDENIDRIIAEAAANGLVINTDRNDTFSGGFHASGNQVLKVYLMGTHKNSTEILKNFIDGTSTEGATLNSGNLLEFAGAKELDIGDLVTDYGNIRGERVGLVSKETGMVLNANIAGASAGVRKFAVEGSGISMVESEPLRYYGGSLSNFDENRAISNDLTFLRHINYWDKKENVHHDVTLDFGGSTKVGNENKMAGYIQGARKDASGNASRYVFANLGGTLNVVENPTISDQTFVDLINSTTESSVSKTLRTADVSSLQAALINAGVKFYVDASDENKSGTIIGLRGTNLNVENGLSGEKDNFFGYDLAFGNGAKLTGDLNLTGNTNNIALEFNGNSYGDSTNIALANGKHSVKFVNTNGAINLSDSNASAGTKYSFENASGANIALSDTAVAVGIDMNNSSLESLNIANSNVALSAGDSTIKNASLNIGTTSIVSLNNTAFEGEINATGNGANVSIENTTAKAKLGLVKMGDVVTNAESNSRLTLNLAENTLESTGDLKGEYDGVNLGDKKVTTIALNARTNNNSATNNVNLHLTNSGGILEFAQIGTDNNFTRAGLNEVGGSKYFAKLNNEAVVNLKGVSLVGDVLGSANSHITGVFASGVESLNNKAIAGDDFVADSKYYGGVLMTGTNGGGLTFVGADSHNFGEGKVNAKNTIVGVGRNTVRFANAGSLDAELFSKWGSYPSAANGGLDYELVGTSITGDIDAKNELSAFGYTNNITYGDWNLVATFDNRDANRGTSNAFGLITNDANKLEVAKSTMNGALRLGNNTGANLTFKGVGSHAFTQESNKAISGGKATNRYIFDGTFDNSNTYTYEAFKDANGEIVIANSSLVFDPNSLEGTGSGSINYYFYKMGARENEQTRNLESALLENYGITLDKSKDSTFSGAFHESGNQALKLTFIGDFEIKELLNSYINAEGLNENNQLTFLGNTQPVDASDILIDYANIRGERVGIASRTSGEKFMGDIEGLYLGEKEYAVQNSGFSVIGDVLNYSNLAGEKPSRMVNNLSYLQDINFYDKHAGARHEITFDFNGNAQYLTIDKNNGYEVVQADKMKGYIQGANKDENGRSSHYTFVNFGASDLDLSAGMKLGDNVENKNGSELVFKDYLADYENTTKNLVESDLASLQTALINSGIKFYVDGTSEAKRGTIIGVRGVNLNLANGYKLSSAADNNFGYDLAFDARYRLNGELDFSANNNELILSFDGNESFSGESLNLNLGTGRHNIAVSHFGEKGLTISAQNADANSSYKLVDVRTGDVNLANAKADLEFSAVDSNMSNLNISAIGSGTLQDDGSVVDRVANARVSLIRTGLENINMSTAGDNTSVSIKGGVAKDIIATNAGVDSTISISDKAVVNDIIATDAKGIRILLDNATAKDINATNAGENSAIVLTNKASANNIEAAAMKTGSSIILDDANASEIIATNIGGRANIALLNGAEVNSIDVTNLGAESNVTISGAKVSFIDASKARGGVVFNVLNNEHNTSINALSVGEGASFNVANSKLDLNISNGGTNLNLAYNKVNGVLDAKNLRNGASLNIADSALDLDISNIGADANISLANSKINNLGGSRFIALNSAGAGSNLNIVGTDIIHEFDGDNLRAIDSTNAGDAIRIANANILAKTRFDATAISTNGSLEIANSVVSAQSALGAVGIEIGGNKNLAALNSKIEAVAAANEESQAVDNEIYAIKSTSTGEVELMGVELKAISNLKGAKSAVGLEASRARRVSAALSNIEIKKEQAKIVGVNLANFEGDTEISIAKATLDNTDASQNPLDFSEVKALYLSAAPTRSAVSEHSIYLDKLTLNGAKTTGAELVNLTNASIMTGDINSNGTNESYGLKVSTSGVIGMATRPNTESSADSSAESNLDSTTDSNADSTFNPTPKISGVNIVNLGNINAKVGMELNAIGNDIIRVSNYGNFNAISQGGREIVARGSGSVEVLDYQATLRDFSNDTNRPFEIIGADGDSALASGPTMVLNGNIAFSRIGEMQEDFYIQDMVSKNGVGALLADANSTTSGRVVLGENVKISARDGLKNIINFNLDKESGLVSTGVNADRLPAVVLNKIAISAIDAQMSKMSNEVGSQMSAMANVGVGAKNRAQTLKEKLAYGGELIQIDIPIQLLSVKSSNRTETFITPYYSRSRLKTTELDGTMSGSGFLAGVTHALGDDNKYLVGIHAGMETRNGTSSVDNGINYDNSSNVTTYIVGAHARARLAQLGDDSVFVRGELNYIGGRANQSVTSGSLSATAVTRGFSGMAIAGYDKALGEDKVLSGELGLMLQQSRVGQTSMDLGALFNSQEVKKSSVYGLANVRYAQNFELDSWNFIPSVSAGVKTLLSSRDYVVLTDVGNKQYRANTLLDRYTGIASLGFDLVHLSDIMRFSLTYTGEFGNYMTTHSVNGRVGFKF